MRAEAEAGKGTASFRDYWKGLAQRDRDFLRGALDNLSSIAGEADAEAKRLRDAQEEAARQEDNADPFGGNPALTGGVQRVGGDAPADDFPGDRPMENAA